MKVFVNFVKTIEVDIPDNLAQIVETHREFGFEGLTDESRDQLADALEKAFDDIPAKEKVLTTDDLAECTVSNCNFPTFTDSLEMLVR